MKLSIDKQADDELNELWDVDEDSAALIEAVYEEWGDSPKLFDAFCLPKAHWNHDPVFEIKRFKYLWDRRYTVYILKIWPYGSGSPIPYRVIYAHHPQQDAYCVLAIMAREDNYESDPQLIERLCTAYEAHNYPRY